VVAVVEHKIYIGVGICEGCKYLDMKADFLESECQLDTVCKKVNRRCINVRNSLMYCKHKKNKFNLKKLLLTKIF